MLGILGELLITAGVLIGLFVVWQLFYTDVVAERTHRQVVADTPWVAPALEDDGIIPDSLKRTDDPPPMDYPAFTEAFATLMVPRWGEDYVKMIHEGTTRADVLDPLGIGHYEGTALPGELGNFAISAHRTTYGKPFTDIDTLVVDDALIVLTEDAWFVYRMTDWEIVQPHEVRVIAPVPNQPGMAPDGRYITLTTCHPRYSAAQRYVVHGELEYWAPTGHGVPAELLEVP